MKDIANLPTQYANRTHNTVTNALEVAERYFSSPSAKKR